MGNEKGLNKKHKKLAVSNPKPPPLRLASFVETGYIVTQTRHSHVFHVFPCMSRRRATSAGNVSATGLQARRSATCPWEEAPGKRICLTAPSAPGSPTCSSISARRVRVLARHPPVPSPARSGSSSISTRSFCMDFPCSSSRATSTLPTSLTAWTSLANSVLVCVPPSSTSPHQGHCCRRLALGTLLATTLHLGGVGAPHQDRRSRAVLGPQAHRG